MTSVAVLRIRPHNLRADGLPRPELVKLAQFLVPACPADEVDVKQHYFQPDASITESSVARLTDRLRLLIQESEVLILDVAYRQIERRLFNIALAEALRRLRADGERFTSLRMLVLMDTFWRSGDPFIAELRQSPWSAMVRVANYDGDILETYGQWAIPPGLSEMCKVSPEVQVAILERRLIRIRGVFRHGDMAAGEEFSKFRYFGDLASDVISALMEAFLEPREYHAFLIPDDSSSWFSNSIRRVGLESRTAVITPAELDNPSDEISDTLEKLRRVESANICITMPIYRHGRTFQRLTEAARRHLSDPTFTNISILAQATGNQSNEWTKTRTIAGDEILHYFIAVPVGGIEADNWLVQAAVALDEIIDPPHEWAPVARTAIWSLFSELGFEKEEPYTDKQRPRISHFPRLRALSREDARWLAYSMLRIAVPNEADNSEVLVIVPKEGSGAVPIAAALEEDLDVAVIQMPRNVLKGEVALEDGAVRLIGDYVDKTIILCDESTVSGRTLLAMDRIVSSYRGRGADYKLAAIAAPIGESAVRVQPLYSWIPVLLEESEEVNG
jgi:hypothetical protein